MLVDAVPTRADALIRTLSVAGHQGLACLDYHADLRSLDATPSATAQAWCDSLFVVPGEAQMVPAHEAQMVPSPDGAGALLICILAQTDHRDVVSALAWFGIIK